MLHRTCTLILLLASAAVSAAPAPEPATLVRSALYTPEAPLAEMHRIAFEIGAERGNPTGAAGVRPASPGPGVLTATDEAAGTDMGTLAMVLASLCLVALMSRRA
jgi:hypothetical protein